MPNFLRNDKLLLIVGFLVLFGSLFCAYHFYASWKTSNITLLPIPNCDLRQGPCSSSLASGEKVELYIRPTHMPVLTSVRLEVKTEKIAVKKILVNFKGAEMNMGEFRYTLKRQTDGTYSAQTILPTCIQDNMVWHAVIQIDAANKHYKAPFILTNQKPTSS